MFQRPDHTYKMDFSGIDLDQFLKDEASPLVTILGLVPGGSKVLDIGAGNGILGWLFKKIGSSAESVGA